MGDFGFVLGGLLSGAGQGLAQDIQNRRDMALQQLRGQQQEQHDQRDAAAASAAADKKYERDKGLLTLGSSLKIAEGTAASANTITEKKVQGGIDLQLQGQRIAGDQALAKLRGQIDQDNSAAAAKLKDELDAGGVQSVQQTNDGRFFIIHNDGTQTITPYVGVPPGTHTTVKDGEDDSSLLGSRGKPGQPAAKPTPKPTPAPISAPPDVPDGQTPAAAKTYTLQEAQQTATNRGIPISEVHKVMRANGYKLTTN